MKKTATLLVILFLLMINQAGISQTVDSLYEVGIWHGFRNAAVTFTFDDGSPNQFSKAVPLFDEFDLPLTLFIVTGSNWGWRANWSTLRTAASAGHEIASHTVTHTSFANINDSLETFELEASQKEINDHITDQKCVTMAYPYCVTGNKSICAQYYIGARICSGIIESSTPKDFMTISSIICGTEGSVKTSDNFLARASSAIRSNGWCVYLLHGVDNDGGYSPVTSQVLRGALEHFSQNQHEYWIGTFGNVIRYIKERDNVTVTELAFLDSCITVQVTDDLDDEIFDFPISIRRQLPDDWNSVMITQNDKPVDAVIVEENGDVYVQFDAVPDGGEVVIRREDAAVVQRYKSSFEPTMTLLQNYPNPFNPTTTIEYSIPATVHVSLKLYNIRGELVKTLVDQEQFAGTYKIILRVANLDSGIYFYTMRAGSFCETKRLVLIK